MSTERDYDEASDVQAKLAAASTANGDEAATVLDQAALAGLAERWDLVRRAKPGIRIFDAAQVLGTSELALRATQTQTRVATRLEIDFEALVELLPTFGRVMALSRNHAVVHETRGVYGGIGFEHHMGIVHHDGIDLRLFMRRWAHAVAIREQVGSEDRRSIHVFDAAGTAVHKVILKPRSNADAWDALVTEHGADAWSPLVVTTAAVRVEQPDAEIDGEALRAGWEAMTDTHDFFPLIFGLGVAREQALRLGPEKFVDHAVPSALERVLNLAVAGELPIMVFAGNPGVVQIFTGQVSRVVTTDVWVNVLDAGFHMHAKRAHLARSYVVRKPTEDGIVSSLEVFDGNGELVVQLFGERKPGRAEREAWREVLAAVVTR